MKHYLQSGLVLVAGFLGAAAATSYADHDPAANRKSDVRESILRKFLKEASSPVESYAATFIAEADSHHLDWRLLPSLAIVESGGGQRDRRNNIFGWANGASALLWAVRPQSSRSTEPDFRSAIAFYPDCRISSGLGWSARVPTLLLIGAKDDVSSPPACRQMIEGARGRSALVRIVVYPGAYHDFDRANLPLHALAGTADAAVPDRGHLGTDPEARADSQKLVAEWLAR